MSAFIYMLLDFAPQQSLHVQSWKKSLITRAPEEVVGLQSHSQLLGQVK